MHLSGLRNALGVGLSFAITLGAYAQSSETLTLLDRRQELLNRYTYFVNETLHVLEELRPRLESLSLQLSEETAAGRRFLPAFRFSDRFSGQAFYGELSGACIRPAGNPGGALRMDLLYEQAATELHRLPPEYRPELIRLRDELRYSFIELMSWADSLERRSRQSIEPASAPAKRLDEILRRCQVLYQDIRGSRDLAHFFLGQIPAQQPAALEGIQQMIALSRQQVRQAAQAEALSAGPLLRSASLQPIRRQYPAIARLGLPLKQSQDSLLTSLEQFARQLDSRYEAFCRGDAPPPALRPLPPHLYHYNQRLLPAFNHGQYGLLAFYNHWSRQGTHVMPAEMDEAPILYLYPYFPPAETSPALLPATQQDTLEADPARHRIFLIDVSASMNKPEKLPVVRELIAGWIREMREEDRITLLLYSEAVEVLIAAAQAAEASEALDAVGRIRTGGKTQLAEGLRQALSLGLSHYLIGGVNQVFLISDGDFDVNFRLMRLARDFPDRGMSLSVIIASKYIRPETWDSLELLARQGGGSALRLSTEDGDQLRLPDTQRKGPP